jgi:hypothetical protein
MTDKRDCEKIDPKDFKTKLTPPLAELLRRLGMRGFLIYSCYRPHLRKEVVMITVGFSTKSDTTKAYEGELEATLIFIDSGMGKLPEEPPQSIIITCPKKIGGDKTDEKKYWDIINFKCNPGREKDWSCLNRQIYVTKECPWHVHSIITVASVNGIIEVLKFFEKEDIEKLEEQKEPHNKILKILEGEEMGG